MSVLKNNSAKYLAAYLFFLCVTTGRFFFESHYAHFVDTKNLIFHHHYWFLFVFLLFLINFKFFLGMHPSRSWWIAFLSPVIFLPLIYNMIFREGGLVKFNYLSAKDPDYLQNIFTFLLFSEKNRPVGIELIVVTLSIFLFSYFISKKPLRSAVCAVSCYLSLMIFAGTVIIAPHKPDFTLFFINSSFKLQNFMSFVYFSASFLGALILFRDEVFVFFRRKDRSILFILVLIATFTVFQFLLRSPSFFDRFILIFHSGLTAFFISTIVYSTKQHALNILLLFHIIISSGILFSALNLF
jgi:hypothetical protein